MARDEARSAMDATKISENGIETLLATQGGTPTGKRNKAVLLLMADSALRVAEVVALHTGDLVREAGTITHVLIRSGKGGKPAKQPVSTRTAVAIARWLEVREAYGIGDGPLFCTVSSGKRQSHFAAGDGTLTPGKALSTTYVRNMTKVAGREACLTVDLHPHTLRHWAITRYLRANRDLELTRKFARHAKIATTAQVYAHLVQEDVDRGLAALPGNGTPEPATDATVTELAAVLQTLTDEQKKAVIAALGGASK